MSNIRRFAALGASSFAAWLAFATPVEALTVTHDVDFEALNQNPFLPGPAFNQFLPTQTLSLPTLRTDFPALHLPFPTLPPTYLQFGASVTGEMALDFWAGLNSGQLNISYPVHTALDIPDNISSGQSFSIGSSASILPSGISYLVPAITAGGGQNVSAAYRNLVQVSAGAPSLTTTNPGIVAGVDLRVTNHNTVNLQGCTELLLATPCVTIADADLPSLGSQTITLVSASTAGNVKILPDVPGVAITKSLPATIPIGGVPPDATFTISTPNLSLAGGLAGTALSAHKDSPIATFSVDIDQLISNVALNPLGLPPLTGSIGPVGYSLLNANASLNGGLYQDLTLTGKTKITLALDHTVRARVNGVDLGGVNVVSFYAGDDVKLSPEGSLTTTKLHVVPTFTFDNNLVNSTGVSINAEIDGDALSAKIPGFPTIGPLVPHGEADVNVADLPLYSNSFAVDMKSIVGAGFDIDFGLNPNALNLKVTPTLLSEDGDGNARFHFDITRNGVTIDTFDIAGRIQRTSLCANCDIVTSYFLPNLEPGDDLTISVDGNTVNLGDIFCLSGQCDQTFDLSSLEDLAQGITAPGFDPVYFATELPDFQLSDPVLSDDFVDHTGSTPDPGVVRTLDLAAYDQFIGVPEPGTLPILAVSLLGMMLLSGRIRARRPRHRGSCPCAA